LNNQTNQPIIAFIGCGNMGAGLIGGLIASGYPATRIRGVEPDNDKRKRLAEEYGISLHAEAGEALKGAATVVLAVKPQALREVVEPMTATLRQCRPLIISVAAGIRTHTLAQWLAPDIPIVRAMPNTPAMIRAGATGLFANAAVDHEHRRRTETLLNAVGICVWVDDEDLIDAVTAISGSGPAYFFLFIEALAQAGAELGLPADQARRLALQTGFGAMRMALESGKDPAILRAQVTSPGGTTEQAIRYFMDNGLPGLVGGAAAAARDRARELAAILAGEKT
jgi:pyrroline-5-carboxylate reductase